MDNVVFVPPEEWQVTHSDLKTCMRAQACYTEDSLNFMTKILDKSATGESTHWPPGILPSKDGKTRMNQSVGAARHEAESVILSMVGDILEKSGTRPKEIDFLIVNCSLFSPTPSLCAMVCHKFKMKEEIKTYNLGGMGCSANLIAIDLAKQLLQNSPGCKALVVSTENLTQNLYMGNQKSMLLQNTLFRCGGCAQLLSSRRGDFRKAKYKLLYTGRTQMTDEDSFKCVYEQEDSDGKRGVALSKDIVNVAGKALKQNFTRLAPHVLPIREQAKTVVNRILIGLSLALRKTEWEFAKELPVPKAYVPNFKTGIDHWCIHAGGRAVIEGVQKNLGLQEQHIAPSMQTLYDWGNTSSSSIWYEAEWIERLGGLKRGHRVLQVAFGSGFKCNSAVWLCLRVDSSKHGVSLKAGTQAHSSHVEVSLPKVSDKGQ
jgi:3-ketoacyl-CoA synthase